MKNKQRAYESYHTVDVIFNGVPDNEIMNGLF